jgi:hypothetical protein
LISASWLSRVVIVGLGFATSGSAFAQEQADAESIPPATDTGTPPPTQSFLKPGTLVVPWSEQEPRWFGAAAFDAGFIYLRPRLSAGYGRPHSHWVGLDINPIFSGEGLAGYLGVRLDTPVFNIRVGGRYWYTFKRSFLRPEESYSVEDIELRQGPKSQFLTWETEVTLNLPIGPGYVLVEAAGSFVTGVPDGYFVYEETLRVVVDPPWVYRARLGYTLALDRAAAVVVGPIVELVGVPDRDAHVWRAGGLVRVSIASDLEARGTFVPAIVTPDPLGAHGGDTFLLGVRYRWATGP